MKEKHLCRDGEKLFSVLRKLSLIQFHGIALRREGKSPLENTSND